MNNEADHFCKTPSRDDIPSVYKSVQVTGGFLYCFAHVIVAVEVENICDKIQSILIVLNFCVETGKVEAIRQVFFVNFAEVFIAPR